MKKRLIFLLCFLFFLLGAIAAYFTIYYKQHKDSDEWITQNDIPLRGKKEIFGDGPLLITTEVLLADIPPPKIKRFDLKIKFLKSMINKSNRMSLGYIAEITTEELDKKNVPEKYLLEKKEYPTATNPKTGENAVLRNGKWETYQKDARVSWIIPAIEEVSYEIHFRFSLLDKDGFEIYSSESLPHTLLSGQKNIFQNIIEEPIPTGIIKSTKQIKPTINFDKCLTCERGY